MHPRFVLLGGTLLMFCAVAAGAFGAHLLRARLAPDLLAVWQTAVQYQAWHALALLALGLYLQRVTATRALGAAAWLLLAGSVVFSGSLYLLALTGVRMLGAVTPLGGVAMLAGWLCWAYALWRTSARPLRR